MVEPHIVEDYHIGNTRIKFADDHYRDKTPRDIEALLRDIAEQAQRQFNAAATGERRREATA